MLFDIQEPGHHKRSSQESVAVGIDLGTTNSLVAYSINQQPKIIADKTGNNILPSIISYFSEGSKVVGIKEKDAVILSSIKRFMGKGIDDFDHSSLLVIDVKTNQNVLYTEIYEKLKDNEDLKLYYNNLIIYVSKLYSFYKQKYDQNIFLNKTNNNIEELKVKNIKYILEDTKQKIIEYQMNKINDDLSISINHILTRATNQIINEFKNFIRPSLTPTNNINKIYDNYDDKIYDKFKDETYKNIIKKINDFLKFLNKNHNITVERREILSNFMSIKFNISF
jgi:hypothetical protein